MSSVDQNIFQQVITYQESMLALLVNQNCMITTFNKKFNNFQDFMGNLGATVSFDLPINAEAVNSLVAQFTGIGTRKHELTVADQASWSVEFDTSQFLYYDVENFMKRWGKSGCAAIGAKVEKECALLAETNTYRFYGNGVDPIASTFDLASALAEFRVTGMPIPDTKCYLPTTAVPRIVNTTLNQFTMNRNNEEASSWEIGSMSNCTFYESNLLPVHISGTEGNEGTTLTVVSTTIVNGAVTAITFSGTDGASDPDSIKAYDKLYFIDNVSGQPNMRYVTRFGKVATTAPVQFQATANAASTGGSQVTVSINPPLVATSGADQNINNQIVAGMQVKVLPNHRLGMFVAGDAAYLAMPRLPVQTPFPTGNMMDEESGTTIRLTYGSIFGQGIQQGLIFDSLTGKTLVPEYAMALIFPV